GAVSAAKHLLLLSALAGAASARAIAQEPSPSLRYGVTKSKDTVTVGEAFEIRVRVRAPSDAEIRFPDNPDTAGTVQGRDPRTIDVADTVQYLDLTAVYH